MTKTAQRNRAPMSDAAATDAQVAEALLEARTVVVCAHVTPDGDAVGAVLGLTLALRAAGIDAVPTLADDHAVPTTYAFLTGADLYRPASELEAPDVFVALDTPNWGRLGVAEPLAHSAKQVVVIDHHADDASYGALNLVDATAASAASIVWRLLPLLGVVPDEPIAAACYVALMTDTGRFSYANTTPRALRDAAEMIEAGAGARRIYTRVYESRSAAALALLGRVLSRITLANGRRVAYSWMNEADLAETGARAEDTENIVDVVRQTGRVDAVVFFKEQPDAVKVSLRAKCPTLDVGLVAREFGGGGHFGAAGAALSLGLPEAISTVLAKLPGGAA
jgi:bifunctional oligoribonuclease and PAP phosphatase NrnA